MPRGGAELAAPVLPKVLTPAGRMATVQIPATAQDRGRWNVDLQDVGEVSGGTSSADLRVHPTLTVDKT